MINACVCVCVFVCVCVYSTYSLIFTAIHKTSKDKPKDTAHTALLKYIFS